MPRKSDLTPEARLAAYWRRRSKLTWSDFDVFQGVPPLPAGGTTGRSRYWILAADQGTKQAWPEITREIALLIAGGYPLNFLEYHVAVGLHYLLADGIPYEEFYRHHWHETADRRGYGPLLRKATRRTGT